MGGIPIEDDIGKEIVTRFHTDINSAGNILSIVRLYSTAQKNVFFCVNSQVNFTPIQMVVKC